MFFTSVTAIFTTFVCNNTGYIQTYNLLTNNCGEKA